MSPLLFIPGLLVFYPHGIHGVGMGVLELPLKLIQLDPLPGSLLRQTVLLLLNLGVESPPLGLIRFLLLLQLFFIPMGRKLTITILPNLTLAVQKNNSQLD